MIHGLLACGLHTTARDITENLLHLVDVVGHVPNGARTYYTNRSQPPLLSAMVMAVAGARSAGPTSGPQPPSSAGMPGPSPQPDAAGSVGSSSVDVEFLRAALPRLIATWHYWRAAPKAVEMHAHHAASQQAGIAAPSRTFTMSRYYADLEQPRPESYREDFELAESLGSDNSTAAAALYRELASAAESGWDFSSRWMVQGQGSEEGQCAGNDCLGSLGEAEGLRQTCTTQACCVAPVALCMCMHSNQQICFFPHHIIL